MNKHYFYYFVHEKKGFGCGTCSCASPLFPLSEITRNIRKKGDSSALISFWKEISREEYDKMNELFNDAKDGQDNEEKD